MSYDTYQLDNSKSLYKVDYAVRGNIKGVLPRRALAWTSYELEGALKKRVKGIIWMMPLSLPGNLTEKHIHLPNGSMPPSPGELWKEGPHQKMIELLNDDAELTGSIREAMSSRKGPPIILSVLSDSWGESIRISGNLLFKIHELVAEYLSKNYFMIVNRIGQHIREVRKDFGGLTF
jgi:hypothetical protein